MNILFVAPRIPFPLDTGGKIRTFNILRQMKARGHQVTLVSFVFKGDPPEAAQVFDEMGIMVIPIAGRDNVAIGTLRTALIRDLPISVAKYWKREVVETLIRAIYENSIDLVHFDHVHMGQYVPCVPGVPTTVDEHNVECLILKRLAKTEKNFLKRIVIGREYRKMRALEKRVCRAAFRTLVVSEEDGRNLEEVCGAGVKYAVVPNGVDVEYFRKTKDERRTKENFLVFTGSMDWAPNSDAVAYFCRDILPLIWKKADAVKFYVVGKNPPESLRQLAARESRIVVTGSVPDVRPYVGRAKIFVVPLRIGGGTRLKILEAMAMQKTVVSTSIGAEGIEARDGVNIELADQPEDFAAKVLSLLAHEERCRMLEENGRKLACERYDWKVVGDKLNMLLEEFTQ